MDALKEVTGMIDGFRYPEHVYFVENMKLHAFLPEGESKVKVFTKPMKFDTRRRQFVKKRKVNLQDYI